MTRPRAEDFLELVQRTRRGGLKLYIGFAAGVGKTYRMLEEARALDKRGVDVVLGLTSSRTGAQRRRPWSKASSSCRGARSRIAA